MNSIRCFLLALFVITASAAFGQTAEVSPHYRQATKGNYSGVYSDAEHGIVEWEATVGLANPSGGLLKGEVVVKGQRSRTLLIEGTIEGDQLEFVVLDGTRKLGLFSASSAGGQLSGSFRGSDGVERSGFSSVRVVSSDAAGARN